MVNDRRTQGDIDAVRRIRKQIGTQRGQHSLSQGHAHQQGAQHIEGADVALADHSIDDLLNQQRVQQGKQLHEEARHQHLHQHGLVLLQGRQEPGQSEALLWGASAALDTQHIKQVVFIPTWQGSGRHQALAGHRITQHQLTTLINLPDHHRATHTQSQRRQGQASELCFIDLHGGGPEPHQIGDRRQLQQPDSLVFTIARELIFKNASQHITPKRKVELPRQHAQTSQWHVDRSFAAEVGVAAVVP